MKAVAKLRIPMRILCFGFGVFAGPTWVKAASPIPIDYVDEIAVGLFPQYASWPRLFDLPVIHKGQLNASLLSHMVQDVLRPCGGPTNDDSAFAVPEILHAGDFFGPGDDDIIDVNGVVCTEGRDTFVWRHVSRPDAMTFVAMPFIVLRLEKSAKPRFIATDDGNHGNDMFADYFVGSDIRISQLPNNAFDAVEALSIPKSAKIASRSLVLRKNTTFLWAPQKLNKNDPATHQILIWLTELDRGETFLTFPPGEHVKELREVIDVDGSVWRLVVDQGSNPQYGVGHMVGWIPP